MKIITYSRIGYNHPSQANWSYGIWKIDCIDTEQSYCMSYTVYESFGGDSRLRNRMSEQHNIHMIETKGIYPEQKMTGIRSMLDMESTKLEDVLVDFIEN